jgi:hypothetical protein
VIAGTRRCRRMHSAIVFARAERLDTPPRSDPQLCQFVHKLRAVYRGEAGAMVDGVLAMQRPHH